MSEEHITEVHLVKMGISVALAMKILFFFFYIVQISLPQLYRNISMK